MDSEHTQTSLRSSLEKHIDSPQDSDQIASLQQSTVSLTHHQTTIPLNPVLISPTTLPAQIQHTYPSSTLIFNSTQNHPPGTQSPSFPPSCQLNQPSYTHHNPQTHTNSLPPTTISIDIPSLLLNEEDLDDTNIPLDHHTFQHTCHHLSSTDTPVSIQDSLLATSPAVQNSSALEILRKAQIPAYSKPLFLRLLRPADPGRLYFPHAPHSTTITPANSTVQLSDVTMRVEVVVEAVADQVAAAGGPFPPQPTPHFFIPQPMLSPPPQGPHASLDRLTQFNVFVRHLSGISLVQYINGADAQLEQTMRQWLLCKQTLSVLSRVTPPTSPMNASGSFFDNPPENRRRNLSNASIISNLDLSQQAGVNQNNNGNDNDFPGVNSLNSVNSIPIFHPTGDSQQNLDDHMIADCTTITAMTHLDSNQPGELSPASSLRNLRHRVALISDTTSCGEYEPISTLSNNFSNFHTNPQNLSSHGLSSTQLTEVSHQPHVFTIIPQHHGGTANNKQKIETTVPQFASFQKSHAQILSPPFVHSISQLTEPRGIFKKNFDTSPPASMPKATPLLTPGQRRNVADILNDLSCPPCDQFAFLPVRTCSSYQCLAPVFINGLCSKHHFTILPIIPSPDFSPNRQNSSESMDNTISNNTISSSGFNDTTSENTDSLDFTQHAGLTSNGSIIVVLSNIAIGLNPNLSEQPSYVELGLPPPQPQHDVPPDFLFYQHLAQVPHHPQMRQPTGEEIPFYFYSKRPYLLQMLYSKQHRQAHQSTHLQNCPQYVPTPQQPQISPTQTARHTSPLSAACICGVNKTLNPTLAHILTPNLIGFRPHPLNMAIYQPMVTKVKKILREQQQFAQYRYRLAQQQQQQPVPSAARKNILSALSQHSTAEREIKYGLSYWSHTEADSVSLNDLSMNYIHKGRAVGLRVCHHKMTGVISIFVNDFLIASIPTEYPIHQVLETIVDGYVPVRHINTQYTSSLDPFRSVVPPFVDASTRKLTNKTFGVPLMNYHADWDRPYISGAIVSNQVSTDQIPAQPSIAALVQNDVVHTITIPSLSLRPSMMNDAVSRFRDELDMLYDSELYHQQLMIEHSVGVLKKGKVNSENRKNGQVVTTTSPSPITAQSSLTNHKTHVTTTRTAPTGPSKPYIPSVNLNKIQTTIAGFNPMQAALAANASRYTRNTISAIFLAQPHLQYQESFIAHDFLTALYSHLSNEYHESKQCEAEFNSLQFRQFGVNASMIEQQYRQLFNLPPLTDGNYQNFNGPRPPPMVDPNIYSDISKRKYQTNLEAFFYFYKATCGGTLSTAYFPQLPIPSDITANPSIPPNHTKNQQLNDASHVNYSAHVSSTPAPVPKATVASSTDTHYIYQDSIGADLENIPLLSPARSTRTYRDNAPQTFGARVTSALSTVPSAPRTTVTPLLCPTAPFNMRSRIDENHIKQILFSFELHDNASLTASLIQYPGITSVSADAMAPPPVLLPQQQRGIRSHNSHTIFIICIIDLNPLYEFIRPDFYLKDAPLQFEQTNRLISSAMSSVSTSSTFSSQQLPTLHPQNPQTQTKSQFPYCYWPYFSSIPHPHQQSIIRVGFIDQNLFYRPVPFCPSRTYIFIDNLPYKTLYSNFLQQTMSTQAFQRSHALSTMLQLYMKHRYKLASFLTGYKAIMIQKFQRYKDQHINKQPTMNDLPNDNEQTLNETHISTETLYDKSYYGQFTASFLSTINSAQCHPTNASKPLKLNKGEDLQTTDSFSPLPLADDASITAQSCTNNRIFNLHTSHRTPSPDPAVVPLYTQTRSDYLYTLSPHAVLSFFDHIPPHILSFYTHRPSTLSILSSDFITTHRAENEPTCTVFDGISGSTFHLTRNIDQVKFVNSIAQDLINDGYISSHNTLLSCSLDWFVDHGKQFPQSTENNNLLSKQPPYPSKPLLIDFTPLLSSATTRFYLSTRTENLFEHLDSNVSGVNINNNINTDENSLQKSLILAQTSQIDPLTAQRLNDGLFFDQMIPYKSAVINHKTENTANIEASIHTEIFAKIPSNPPQHARKESNSFTQQQQYDIFSPTHHANPSYAVLPPTYITRQHYTPSSTIDHPLIDNNVLWTQAGCYDNTSILSCPSFFSLIDTNLTRHTLYSIVTGFLVPSLQYIINKMKELPPGAKLENLSCLRSRALKGLYAYFNMSQTYTVYNTFGAAFTHPLLNSTLLQSLLLTHTRLTSKYFYLTQYQQYTMAQLLQKHITSFYNEFKKFHQHCAGQTHQNTNIFDTTLNSQPDDHHKDLSLIVLCPHVSNYININHINKSLSTSFLSSQIDLFDPLLFKRFFHFNFAEHTSQFHTITTTPGVIDTDSLIIPPEHVTVLKTAQSLTTNLRYATLFARLPLVVPMRYDNAQFMSRFENNLRWEDLISISDGASVLNEPLPASEVPSMGLSPHFTSQFSPHGNSAQIERSCKSTVDPDAVDFTSFFSAYLNTVNNGSLSEISVDQSLSQSLYKTPDIHDLLDNVAPKKTFPCFAHTHISLRSSTPSLIRLDSHTSNPLHDNSDDQMMVNDVCDHNLIYPATNHQLNCHHHPSAPMASAQATLARAKFITDYLWECFTLSPKSFVVYGKMPLLPCQCQMQQSIRFLSTSAPIMGLSLNSYNSSHLHYHTATFPRFISTNQPLMDQTTSTNNTKTIVPRVLDISTHSSHRVPFALPIDSGILRRQQSNPVLSPRSSLEKQFSNGSHDTIIPSFLTQSSEEPVSFESIFAVEKNHPFNEHTHAIHNPQPTHSPLDDAQIPLISDNSSDIVPHIPLMITQPTYIPFLSLDRCHFQFQDLDLYSNHYLSLKSQYLDVDDLAEEHTDTNDIDAHKISDHVPNGNEDECDLIPTISLDRLDTTLGSLSDIFSIPTILPSLRYVHPHVPPESAQKSTQNVQKSEKPPDHQISTQGQLQYHGKVHHINLSCRTIHAISWNTFLSYQNISFSFLHDLTLNMGQILTHIHIPGEKIPYTIHSPVIAIKSVLPGVMSEFFLSLTQYQQLLQQMQFSNKSGLHTGKSFSDIVNQDLSTFNQNLELLLQNQILQLPFHVLLPSFSPQNTLQNKKNLNYTRVPVAINLSFNPNHLQRMKTVLTSLRHMFHNIIASDTVIPSTIFTTEKSLISNLIDPYTNYGFCLLELLSILQSSYIRHQRQRYVYSLREFDDTEDAALNVYNFIRKMLRSRHHKCHGGDRGSITAMKTALQTIFHIKKFTPYECALYQTMITALGHEYTTTTHHLDTTFLQRILNFSHLKTSYDVWESGIQHCSYDWLNEQNTIISGGHDLSFDLKVMQPPHPNSPSINMKTDQLTTFPFITNTSTATPVTTTTALPPLQLLPSTLSLEQNQINVSETMTMVDQLTIPYPHQMTNIDHQSYHCDNNDYDDDHHDLSIDSRSVKRQKSTVTGGPVNLKYEESRSMKRMLSIENLNIPPSSPNVEPLTPNSFQPQPINIHGANMGINHHSPSANLRSPMVKTTRLSPNYPGHGSLTANSTISENIPDNVSIKLTPTLCAQSFWMIPRSCAISLLSPQNNPLLKKDHLPSVKSSQFFCQSQITNLTFNSTDATKPFEFSCSYLCAHLGNNNVCVHTILGNNLLLNPHKVQPPVNSFQMTDGDINSHNLNESNNNLDQFTLDTPEIQTGDIIDDFLNQFKKDGTLNKKKYATKSKPRLCNTPPVSQLKQHITPQSKFFPTPQKSQNADDFRRRRANGPSSVCGSITHDYKDQIVKYEQQLMKLVRDNSLFNYELTLFDAEFDAIYTKQ